MKFEVNISTNKFVGLGKRTKLRGFTSLNDAVATVLALGPLHPEGTVSVWLPQIRRDFLDGALLGVFIPKDEQQAYNLRAAAERNLKKALAERKAHRERKAWRRKMEETEKDFGNRLLKNLAARTAYFANDFATAERIMRETAPVFNLCPSV